MAIEVGEQDPGFIDHVANKKADVVRIYLPPDTNTLLSVADHCLLAGAMEMPQS
jgi:phosphoketolase